MNEDKKKAKKVGYILGIIAFIALAAGATYAWLTWRSNNILIAGSSECFDVIYYRKDLGTQENPAKIKFQESYVGAPDYAEVGLSLDPSCATIAGKGSIYLTTNVETSNNILTGGLYYTLVSVKNNVESFIKEGPITTTGEILLQDNIFVNSSTTDTRYRVYIWINGALEDNEGHYIADNTYVGGTYTGEIRAEVVSQEDNTPPKETIVTHITNLYSNATKTTVENNSITYNYADSVKLMNDRLGSMSTDINGGNIRYYGASPNNYIDIGDKYETAVTQGNWVSAGAPFADVAACNDWATGNNITNEQIAENTNGEYATVSDFCSTSTIPAGTPILWRVIGVFNGKLRIRRNDSIGTYSFDTSDSSVNDGWGINQWGPSGSYEGADLMRLLNPGYERNSVNNSLYWTSGNGTCYNGNNNATTSCNFTNTGLSSTAKKYIVDQTLYLGGFDSNQIYANAAYSTERGSNVIQNPADNVTRTLSWTGKVGLIYPSDYGYAADFTNSNCQSDLYSNSQNCTETWMNGVSWMISPWAADPDGEMCVNDDGFCSYGLNLDLGGWPVLTLSSDALLETGDGSKSTPYVLAA